MNRDDRLDKELRFHLEQHVADLIARGHSPEAARRMARIELGGIEQAKESCRDVRPTRWLEDFFQDVRYALRTLRQRTGFAAVAILTLALGIGATTVMFTIINCVLFRPFPYAHPENLLKLRERTNWHNPWGDLWYFSYPNFLDCSRESRTLDLSAWARTGGTLSSPGPADYLDSYYVSANLFPLLGVSVFKGRNFLPEEDHRGAASVTIVSYDFWQHRFGGSPSAIGGNVIFDGNAYTVVGIMPAGFRLDDEQPDLFIPLGQNASPRMDNREWHSILVRARLRPGATLAQADAELAVIGRQLEARYPKSNRGRTFITQPHRPDSGDVQATLWLLLGSVSVVLLIACANIASLLLARTVSRERELAMRMALGARRGRLVRQCLTESAVLGVGGGAIGVALAAFGLHPFVVFWPGSLPRAEQVRLDWRVLLFALGVSLISGVFFGLAPALRVRAREFEHALRAGARTVVGNSRRLQGAFVVAEIALAMVLLVSAGLLAGTLLHLSALDPGIDIHNVLTARAALSPSTLVDPARTRASWREILDRARRVPGVESIAMIDTVPMRQGVNEITYAKSAAPVAPERQPLVLAASVTPDYLNVMRIPLREGRFFADQDRMGNASVVVIDDVMAQQAFPGENPLGKQLWIDVGPNPATVVGVVGHVRQWGLAGDDGARVRAQLYYPFAQLPDPLVRRWSELMSIAVRTKVEPLTVVEPLRREVRGVANDQVLYEIRTMEQLAATSLARQRFLLLLFGLFAGLALLLACVGIYGVLAYLTSRRVPEIGVRMALGATSGQVTRMVLRQSVGMIFLGVVTGGFGAIAAARLLARFVAGMQPAEPWTIAAMITLLFFAALMASFVPARRASRIDPVLALRQE